MEKEAPFRPCAVTYLCSNYAQVMKCGRWQSDWLVLGTSSLSKDLDDHSQVTLWTAVKEQIVCGQEAKTETPAGRSFLISREWVLEHLTCAKVTLGYGHAAWCPDVPGVPHAGEQRWRCSDLGWEGKVSEFSVENVGHLASNQTKGKWWVWRSGRAWCKVQQNGTQIPCLLLPNLEPLTNYT